MEPVVKVSGAARALLDFASRRCVPVCLMVLPFLSVHAQVGTSMTVGPLLAYATVSVRSGLDEVPSKPQLSKTLSDSETDASDMRHSLDWKITSDTFSLSVGRRFNTLSRTTHHSGLLDGAEVVLFRKELNSHYNYRSWARLDSGYGKYLDGADPIGRTCTSGAGVQDPSWLYVKMSVKF